jgi:bacterioferritin (cytochrome b1)
MKGDELHPGQPFMNRTGIMTHPQLSAELIKGVKRSVPSSGNDTAAIVSARATYIEEALPLGSRPAIVTIETDEAAETEAIGAAEPTQQNGLAVLLDKLGERLAFERQGTRLYEACIQKCELIEESDAGPSVEDLRHICEEELEHFKMLQKAIIEMGGDATVQTPSADVAGVLSHGVLQVVTDPRTTVPQMLQALLVAELADNDGWGTLGELAAVVGNSDLEEQCRGALEEEEEHLEKVRDWLTSMTLNEANLTVENAALDDEDDEDKEPRGEKQQRRESKSGHRTRKTRTPGGNPKSSRSRKGKSRAKK